MTGATAIRTLLLADSAVTAILGAGDALKVYPNQAPQGTPNPCATVRLENTALRSKNTHSATDTRAIINVFTDGYDQGVDLAQKIKTALDLQSSGDINKIYFQDSDEDYDHSSESHQFTMVFDLFQNSDL